MVLVDIAPLQVEKISHQSGWDLKDKHFEYLGYKEEGILSVVAWIIGTKFHCKYVKERVHWDRESLNFREGPATEGSEE